jgi:hypothetical protein
MTLKRLILLIVVGVNLGFVGTAFAFYDNYEQLDVCLKKKIDGGEKRHCLRNLVVKRERELNYLSENEIPFKHDCWLSGYATYTSQLVAKGIVKQLCKFGPDPESESVELLACDQKKIKNGKKRHCYRDLVIQTESEFQELLSNYGANIEIQYYRLSQSYRKSYSSVFRINIKTLN